MKPTRNVMSELKTYQKKKILLIYPKTGVKNLLPQTPLSLLTLCPGLEANGLQPIIVDTRIENNYQEKIEALFDDLIFVGVTTMTGKQLYYACQISQWIKEIAPQLKIVWGGIHPTMLPHQTINNSFVDIVVTGEGEKTIVQLAEALSGKRDLQQVRGLYFKEKDGQINYTGYRELMDIKDLKMPSWHLINIGKYSEIGIQSGRGCPWKCRFCYNVKFNERRWRGKKSSEVIEELKLLKNKYHIDRITFYDDNFFTSKERIRDICEKMVADGLDIKWSTTCRADDLAGFDDEFIQLLKSSGMHILFIGSESGSERVLKEIIDKHITTNDIRNMARKTSKHRLRVHTSFMVGLPGETVEDRRKTLSLMDEIKGIDKDIYITTTCIYTPYPGNPLYEESIKKGFSSPNSLLEWSEFNYFHCNLPWLSKKERRLLENLSFITRFVFWNQEIKERYLKFYYYPFYYLLRASALLRWRYRFFRFCYEWGLFRIFVEELE